VPYLPSGTFRLVLSPSTWFAGALCLLISPHALVLCVRCIFDMTFSFTIHYSTPSPAVESTHSTIRFLYHLWVCFHCCLDGIHLRFAVPAAFHVGLLFCGASRRWMPFCMFAWADTSACEDYSLRCHHGALLKSALVSLLCLCTSACRAAGLLFTISRSPYLSWGSVPSVMQDIHVPCCELTPAASPALY